MASREASFDLPLKKFNVNLNHHSPPLRQKNGAFILLHSGNPFQLSGVFGYGYAANMLKTGYPRKGYRTTYFSLPNIKIINT
jgi:hypothetical protein